MPNVQHSYFNQGCSEIHSSDNDPLFLYHQWQANLRILGVDEIKTVPYTPLSHPFIERLIGTIRREFLDHTLFWNNVDLERKLADLQAYYNHHRTHNSLGGDTPAKIAGRAPKLQTKLKYFRWQTHCRGIYQLPAAALVSIRHAQGSDALERLCSALRKLQTENDIE